MDLLRLLVKKNKKKKKKQEKQEDKCVLNSMQEVLYDFLIYYCIYYLSQNIFHNKEKKI